MSEFYSHWNHRAYAKKHGYSYINCGWPAGVSNKYLTKMVYIKEYIRKFDWIFWIDDDALFVNLDLPLEEFIPKGDKFLSFCRSPITNDGDFVYLGSGQFFIRGGELGASFIDAVLAVDISEVNKWWRPELGLFTRGDQDAIVYLLHEDDRFIDRAVIHPYTSFNSRISDLLRDPTRVRVLHFTGIQQKKLRDHGVAMDFLKYGPALLPDEVEEDLLSIWYGAGVQGSRQAGSSSMPFSYDIVRKGLRFCRKGASKAMRLLRVKGA